jgi:hypothetical protein
LAWKGNPPIPTNRVVRKIKIIVLLLLLLLLLLKVKQSRCRPGVAQRVSGS